MRSGPGPTTGGPSLSALTVVLRTGVYQRCGPRPRRCQSVVAAYLLDDLRRWRPAGIEVLLTLNIEEALPFHPGHFPFSVRSILNVSPRGFAANHNAAFELARGDFFCILNPDIRLTGDPFPELMDELKNPSLGAVAPLILGPNRAIEDSARPFPPPLSLFFMALATAPKLFY